MIGQRLHGTDGIRGLISDCSESENPIEKLILQREISPSLMQVIGFATGSVIGAGEGGAEPPLVVIGWDRRSGNDKLVSSLSLGLREAGCVTQLVGELPTPGLLHCLLLLDADAGMMVTASHNPATDSGVKLFDKNGFKSMPPLEDLISAHAWDYVSTLSTIQSIQPSDSQELPLFDGLKAYRRHLKKWLGILSKTLGIDVGSLDANISPNGLILDCSGGASTDWFGFGLVRRGLECEEISSVEQPINHNCGAGEFSSTGNWSIAELLETEHSHLMLIEISERLKENDGMPPWSQGQLIGAALDGDGDRCLLIEGTKNGIKIVDGDQMAFDWLHSLKKSGFSQLKLAHSIESDLCLPATCNEFEIETTQTAIGDRWLSDALREKNDSNNQFMNTDEMPAICGCEDSGHLVMPTPHPTKPGHWGLAGDGAATLLAQLFARAKLGSDRVEVARGWKTRVGIKGTDRTLWDGINELSNMVENLVSKEFGEGVLHRQKIVGEANLLLLSGNQDGVDISIGIRNSGTEAKTSITARTSDAGFELSKVTSEIVDLLKLHLTD